MFDSAENNNQTEFKITIGQQENRDRCYNFFLLLNSLKYNIELQNKIEERTYEHGFSCLRMDIVSLTLFFGLNGREQEARS